jgi:hypothetical protein
METESVTRVHFFPARENERPRPCATPGGGRDFFSPPRSGVRVSSSFHPVKDETKTNREEQVLFLTGTLRTLPLFRLITPISGGRDGGIKRWHRLRLVAASKRSSPPTV